MGQEDTPLPDDESISSRQNASLLNGEACGIREIIAALPEKEVPQLLHIKGRVHIIHILLVQFFPQKLGGFPKSLEMDDLPLPEEFNGIIHIRIIR